uniref:Uncharacterized protein n=1 Tax=Manihot esculenta TaxID=3983 RepID=A0A2C9VQI5_MANES
MLTHLFTGKTHTSEFFFFVLSLENGNGESILVSPRSINML